MSALVPALTLKEAQQILEAATNAAITAGYNPMTIVVIDTGGHLIALARQDGASFFRFDVALGKAFAAVSFGLSSREVAAKGRENPNFYVSLAASAQGKFVPHTGAVCIKNSDGIIVGAVGASGAASDEDEEVCMLGVKAAGFQY